MDNKAAFKQKFQAQLEEWKADFDKLKAETKGAYAEGQLAGSKEAKEIDGKMEEAKSLLSKLEQAGEKDFEAIKAEIEKSWNAIQGVWANFKRESKKV